MLNALRSDDMTQYSNVSGRPINDLARFFQGALGDYTKDTATGDAMLAASTLINYLKEDLQNDLVELVVEDGTYDMTATFEMASRTNNDYSWLELFWSVD